MTLPVWPITLPCPVVPGITRMPISRMTVFKADKPGAEKRRVVGTAKPYEQTETYHLTADELEDLLDFVDDAPNAGTGGGVSRFNKRDPRTDTPCQAEFLEDGLPAISETEITGLYDVTIKLRYWP